MESVPVDGGEVLRIESEYAPDVSLRFQSLYQALDKLPQKEKVTIILFYFEDRSIKEIASILGIPVGTVKYHLSCGRSHLKEMIRL